MTADLSPLLEVAKAWQKMGERFGELKTNYATNVQNALANGNWQGQAFGAHQDSAKATASEFEAAKAEAEALAGLLTQAHTELTGLQKAVRDLVTDAESKDFKVDSSGKATYVGFDKLSPKDQQALHHDPDYSKLVADAAHKAQEWTDAIAKAVHAVDEADQGVQRALSRASAPSMDPANFGGFNAHAQTDLAKAGAPDPVVATKTDAWKVTGPDVGVSVSGPGSGKEGSAKAYADLFHVTGTGQTDYGWTQLDGKADFYGGARASANYGFTNKGASAQAEVSAGLRAQLDGSAESGPAGVYGRANGFAGAEASVSAKAGREGVSVGAKAFAGAKGSVTGGVDIGGIRIGGTAEGWAGPGAEAKWGYEKQEDGTWDFGSKIGLSPVVGGALGIEITVDPKKVSKTAHEVADVLGDAAHEVGDAASSAKHAAGKAVHALTDLF
ncbi:hypothetical protein ACIHFE_18785 [Streptomyces sp. NPDC052396]|uniref:hypothetical protein n=1 Tax=Streptomyces sp. NPDC052396 TaxID=3365689 RepID=UPI0037D1F0B2